MGRHMADDGIDNAPDFGSAQDAFERIQKRLCENIIGGNHKEFLEKASLKTLQLIVKDKVLQDVKDLIFALNNEFSDVTFTYIWRFSDRDQRIWNADYNEEDFEDMDQFEASDEYFYDTDLDKIDIKINYYWKRTCSLGCNHSHKRFYIFNILKILDMTAYHKTGMPVRKLVKEFIPDFFYDPMPSPVKKKTGKQTKTPDS